MFRAAWHHYNVRSMGEKAASLTTTNCVGP
jgi:hypothetical protein